MGWKRHQELWQERPNNASQVISPLQTQIQNIYSFCQNFNEHLTQFVYTSIHLPKFLKPQQPPFLVDSQDSLIMLVQILNEQRFIFLDTYSDSRCSYKGYVSWLLIATQTRLYVVDAARLHDQCARLKEALERKQLIKFVHECQEVLNALKRDWQIFMPNVFDLEVIQRSMFKQGKCHLHSRTILKQFLISSTNPLNYRPIKPTTLQKFQDFFESQLSLLLNLDKFFTTEDPSYQCYAYFNHYEFLLKSYYHQTAGVRQRDEMERARHGENLFAKYGTHEEIMGDPKNQEKDWWLKNEEEEKVAIILYEWREHVAKMRDVGVEEVLPYKILCKLAKTNINSILQISQLCTPSSVPPALYNLSLEDFEQIFELLQLHKQQSQEFCHELSIPRRMPYFKATDQKPIKQLFEQIKLTDLQNDWLNKKTDESVRLYKEIVSISEFDNSIVEEYLKEVTKIPSSLTTEDVNMYLKYAECLRLGNHKRLQEMYERTKTQQNSANVNFDDHYFQENFIQGEDYKDWDQIEQEINFPTMDTINQPLSNQSLTSLKSLANMGVQSCKNLTTAQSTRVLREKQLNSLRVLQSPSIFSAIEPLPENIEVIYMEAARAKKSYVMKGQKKSNKGAKKEGKSKVESSLKREEEFVPRKEEIFNLVYY